MSIQFRLTVMNFMQFFVWGSWLISLGAYMIVTLGFSGSQVGSIYATMGVGSLFMPGLMGIVADRWVNAERMYGICHLIGAGLLLWASAVKDFDTLYLSMLLNAMVYMPTIALNNTVSYKVLEQGGLNVIQTFPPIRVWGTVGFIAAMWMVDFAGWTKSELQLYISAGGALFLGLYAFTMPKCPPAKSDGMRSLVSALGLDAFVLFRRQQMLVFFLFAMLLGAALQITNAFGGAFLDDFKTAYPGSFGVEHPNLLLSISQISETLFILTIPFFLHRFGIKKVMLISIFAWEPKTNVPPLATLTFPAAHKLDKDGVRRMLRLPARERTPPARRGFGNRRETVSVTHPTVAKPEVGGPFFLNAECADGLPEALCPRTGLKGSSLTSPGSDRRVATSGPRAPSVSPTSRGYSALRHGTFPSGMHSRPWRGD